MRVFAACYPHACGLDLREMDCAAVIRIRYRDFWSGSDNLPGLHGIAVRRGSRVTVYLQPGLTGRERTAVFRRLRQEASRGCGPELPLPRLVMAVAADRLRMTLRVLGGAVPDPDIGLALEPLFVLWSEADDGAALRADQIVGGDADGPAQP